jgi:hypothetical protein
MGRVGVGCYVGLSPYTSVLHYGKKLIRNCLSLEIFYEGLFMKSNKCFLHTSGSSNGARCPVFISTYSLPAIRLAN